MIHDSQPRRSVIGAPAASAGRPTWSNSQYAVQSASGPPLRPYTNRSAPLYALTAQLCGCLRVELWLRLQNMQQRRIATHGHVLLPSVRIILGDTPAQQQPFLHGPPGHVLSHRIFTIESNRRLAPCSFGIPSVAMLQAIRAPTNTSTLAAWTNGRDTPLTEWLCACGPLWGHRKTRGDLPG